MLLFWTLLLTIACIQVPSMVKKKELRLLAVYLFLWAGAGVYSSLVVSRAPIPNPTEIILSIQEYISNILF